jgi:putative oxidoreductase
MATVLRDYAALPLRLILGVAFLYHGFPKVFYAEGHTGFVRMLQDIGIPAPELMAWVVGVVEVLGGLALIAGAFVMPAATLLIVDMLVALFKVHLPNGFNFIHIVGMTDTGPQFGIPGYEVNLIYIAGLVSLILGGAGALSVDTMLRARRGAGPSPASGA